VSGKRRLASEICRLRGIRLPHEQNAAPAQEPDRPVGRTRRLREIPPGLYAARARDPAGQETIARAHAAEARQAEEQETVSTRRARRMAGPVDGGEGGVVYWSDGHGLGPAPAHEEAIAAMFKFEVRVGRLVEITLASPLTAQEFEDYITAARLGLLSLPGKAVLVIDMTRLAVMSGDVAQRGVDLIRRNNPSIERGAYLLPQLRGSTSMQVMRMLRDARSETRRVFDDKRSLRAWLGEVLTPSEVRRLGAFLPDIPGGNDSP
jgi:hypothetical protein